MDQPQFGSGRDERRFREVVLDVLWTRALPGEAGDDWVDAHEVSWGGETGEQVEEIDRILEQYERGGLGS